MMRFEWEDWEAIPSSTPNRQGQYSIRIQQQWRICFTWDNGNAKDVEIVDYHA